MLPPPPRTHHPPTPTPHSLRPLLLTTPLPNTPTTMFAPPPYPHIGHCHSLPQQNTLTELHALLNQSTTPLLTLFNPPSTFATHAPCSSCTPLPVNPSLINLYAPTSRPLASSISRRAQGGAVQCARGMAGLPRYVGRAWAATTWQTGRVVHRETVGEGKVALGTHLC